MSITFTREDWKMFRNMETLCQKAGVHREYIPRLVVKELVDNALDISGNCELHRTDQNSFIVADHGDGINPDLIETYFSINRPMVSSKLLRLPSRGALGNGLRVVTGAGFSQQSGKINLYTRHNNDCTSQYPELLTPFKDDIVLDGEVTCMDPKTGLPDFEGVMTRFKTHRQDKILHFTGTLSVTFVIFDILIYKGKDLRRLPLMERKAILSTLNLPGPAFGIIPYIESAGEDFFEQIRNRGLEGMVGKRKNSHYFSHRSDSWQKIINWSYAEVFITGYQKKGFGWHTAILDDLGKLRPTGIIEHGPGLLERQAFYLVSQGIVSRENQNIVFLKPKIQAEVKFRNWTKSGFLRTPVFTKFVM